MTKQDVIELLEELESGVDHSNLSRKALIAAKKKRHIGPLKNKHQLIKALKKAAGAVRGVRKAEKEGKEFV